jgi:hypothetical protein
MKRIVRIEREVEEKSSKKMAYASANTVNIPGQDAHAPHDLRFPSRLHHPTRHFARWLRFPTTNITSHDINSTAIN